VRLKHRARAACALAAALWVSSPSAGAQAPVRVTDDAGQPVTLVTPARRIVSLAPHLTEILFAAGAGSRVVGVSAYSDYPAATRGLPRVGSALQVNLERLLALEPDLVAAWASGTPRTTVDRLRALGIAVFVSEPRRLEDIATTMRRLGALAGSAGDAARAADDLLADLSALRSRFHSRAPVSVFFEIEHRPLMTLGGSHVFNDVLEACGGRNVFAEINVLAPAVGLEAVLARNPDVILVSGSLSGIADVLASWRLRTELSAARSGHVHALPADLVVRHGPRLLDGARIVCELLEAARADRGD